MKTVKNNIVLFLIAAVLVFPSCGGEGGSDPTPEPTEIEKAAKILISAPWKISTVTVDGLNKNDLFTGLTISFTAVGYSANNGGPVWPGSGTWAFSDATAKSIKRNDDVVITLESLTETALTLSLTWSKTTLSTGRSGSIAGKHVFTFTK